VTRKAIPGFIAGDIAAECLVEARRRIQSIPNSPIQGINAAVIADAALIEFPIMSQNIGLSDSSISKNVRNWFAYTLIAIRHAVYRVCTIVGNFISVIARTKGQVRVYAQHVVGRYTTQSMCH